MRAAWLSQEGGEVIYKGEQPEAGVSVPGQFHRETALFSRLRCV